MKKFIPYGRQFVDEDDIQAAVEVLQSKLLTQGPKTAEFELALCKTTSAEFAVAVNSGTSALHIACLAAGVKKGDEVITSPITFVASANCIVYCGGTPIFTDIDPKTYNISAEEIERRINKSTKAVIPVHFAGQSCDMETIQQIVKSAEKKYGHKIYIIEDACHALGSKYKESDIGSCAYSDMAVMSFHPVKHITTGEGGVVFTNNPELNKKLTLFRSHGIISDPEEVFSKELAIAATNTYNPWYYEQQVLGYNYRLTNIQAALGLSQLKKLSIFCKRRREIVNQYYAAFKDIEFLQVPFEDPNCESNFHLYVLLFDFAVLGIDRARLIFLLREAGFATQVHYIPVHLQHYYRKNYKTNWGNCPNAEAYYKKCLSIPLFPSMCQEDIEMVIKAIVNKVGKRDS
ncbi:MAG: UDP-4-amino-4,6-dideoxy-N-acetyl-beta-L-altrosamine transaminase [Desulfobacteraceae bacterium]|nr:UDP-4-amino-4,6-dideoxy-N-acetyl-beta-L-altrosamine transaminase [Desulfobacteraceae bacterium]